MKKNKNTIVLDIDGVLADYRLGLLYWVKIHYPEMASICDKHMGVKDTWLSYVTMQVEYVKWLKVLENFRMSGGKQALPLISSADYLTTTLKEKGFKLVLVTSRPIDIYPGIYRDTVEWLKRYNLPYDLILWAKNKVELLYRLKMLSEICFAVDDEVSHIHNYDLAGVPTFWLNHYGTSIPSPLSYGQEIKGLTEIFNFTEHLKEEDKNHA